MNDGNRKEKAKEQRPVLIQVKEHARASRGEIEASVQEQEHDYENEKH